MVFLITGASGILAQALIQRLSDLGHVVHSFSRHPDLINGMEEGGGIENGRLADFREVVDCVIHCAFTRSESLVALTESLTWTQEVASFCEKRSVPKVINISSQSVYPNNLHGQLISEKTPVSPSSRYGLAKYASELIFNRLSHPTVVNIRLASLVGKGMEARALYKMTLSALQEGKLQLSGGKQYVSLLSVNDAAQGVLNIALSKKTAGKDTVNLASHESLTLLEVAGLIDSQVQAVGRAPVAIETKTIEEGCLPSLRLSCFKLEAVYGLKISNSVYNAIADIVVNFKTASEASA